MKTKASILTLTTLVLAACSFADHADDQELVEGSEAAVGAGGAPGETHPYQSRLICERKPGSILVGVMYDISSGAKVKVTEISSNGNVGACELAIRASRNRKVCVPGSGGWTVRDLNTNTSTGSYSKLSLCTAITRAVPRPLRTEPGYVDIISPAEIAPFRAALPTLSDPAVEAALKDARTIWYDEASLVFTYQDSFGSPKGLRANRVGFDVGNTASEPDIHALVEYFQPSKFKFPFAFSAGATFEDNVYVLNFWRPPPSTPAGPGVKPVKIWKNNSHWQWVFPVGTTIGEVLFIQAPDDKSWYALEVRSRVRAIDRWVTGVFRPYVHATDLANAIKDKRPAWDSSADLRSLVTAAESTETLTPSTLSAPSYQAIFPPMQGALDYLPATADTALIKELLTGRTFTNAMGERWKTNAAGTLKTYAASTKAPFHIVPREYKGGLLESTEAACRKCHEQTSRPLNNLDGRVVLYGEIWGEDEIFTWHPFAIDEDSFSVGDGTRFVNQRLVTAGLVEMTTASSALSDPSTYKALPKPYVPQYE